MTFSNEEGVKEREYLIDEDANFLSLIHFIHLYSPLLPDLDTQLCLGNTQDFSPVHLRHFFLYCAEETLLLRPFFVFLKWINQRLPHPSVFKCLQREYRRREMEQPSFLEELGEEAMMVTLGIEQRVRLMHDLVCVFIPWNGDDFRELCGNKEFPPEHSRIQPLQDVYVIADRFLYEKQSQTLTKWTLLAYDKISWESFFSDSERNPFLKSRKSAAKTFLAELRDFLPSVLEHCKFDERCHRELEQRQLQESRKRSPRITERSARRDALERLRSSESLVKRKSLSEEAAEIPQKRNREERMAKREQLRVMQQLKSTTNDKEEEETAEESSEFFCVDDEQLGSNSQPYESEEEEEEFINVTNTSSPIKKVILRFESTATIIENDDKVNAPLETKEKENDNQMMDALLQAATSSDPIPDSFTDYQFATPTTE